MIPSTFQGGDGKRTKQTSSYSLWTQVGRNFDFDRKKLARELETGKPINLGAKDDILSVGSKDSRYVPVGAKRGTEGIEVSSQRTVGKNTAEISKGARDVRVDDASSPKTKHLAQNKNTRVHCGVDDLEVPTGATKDQKHEKSSSEISNTSDAQSNLAKLFRGHGDLLAGCGLTSNKNVVKDKKCKDQVDQTSGGTIQEKSFDDIEELEPESDVEILDGTEDDKPNKPKEDNISFGSETSNDDEDDFLQYFGEDEPIFPDDDVTRPEIDEEIDDDDVYEEVYEEIDEDEENTEQNDLEDPIRDVQEHSHDDEFKALNMEKGKDDGLVSANMQEDEDDDIEIECILEAKGSGRQELTPVDLRPPMVSVPPQPRTPVRGSSSLAARPSMSTVSCYSTNVGGEYMVQNGRENLNNWPPESSRQSPKSGNQTVCPSRNERIENRYIDLNAPFQAQGRILAAKKRVALVQGIRGSPKRPDGTTSSPARTAVGIEPGKGLRSIAGTSLEVMRSNIGTPVHGGVDMQRREQNSSGEVNTSSDDVVPFTRSEQSRVDVGSASVGFRTCVDPGEVDTPPDEVLPFTRTEPWWW